MLNDYLRQELVEIGSRKSKVSVKFDLLLLIVLRFNYCETCTTNLRLELGCVALFLSWAVRVSQRGRSATVMLLEFTIQATLDQCDNGASQATHQRQRSHPM